MDATVAVVEVLFLLERLARDAVPALVDPVVDVARLRDARHERRDAGPVALLGGPYEVVERDIEPRPDVAERGLHPVAERDGVFVELARALKDILRVLIVPHQETGVDPTEPLVARDDVGRDLLVRGP